MYLLNVDKFIHLCNPIPIDQDADRSHLPRKFPMPLPGQSRLPLPTRGNHCLDVLEFSTADQFGGGRLLRARCRSPHLGWGGGPEQGETGRRGEEEGDRLCREDGDRGVEFLDEKLGRW